MSYRQIVIDEDNGELLKNETFDEEYEDESCEGCEEVCLMVDKMLEEVGIKTDDHDEMLEELKELKLVKKVVEGNGNGEKKVKKIVKKENGTGKKR